MILCLAYVVDDGLKAFLVVDMSALPRSAHHFWRIAAAEQSCAESGRRRTLLQRLEPAGAPGFELLPDLLGFAVARHFNPACSGLSNLTYLPLAGAGSEALPSLARQGQYAAASGTSLPG